MFKTLQEMINDGDFISEGEDFLNIDVMNWPHRILANNLDVCLSRITYTSKRLGVDYYNNRIEGYIPSYSDPTTGEGPYYVENGMSLKEAIAKLDSSAKDMKNLILSMKKSPPKDSPFYLYEEGTFEETGDTDEDWYLTPSETITIKDPNEQNPWGEETNDRKGPYMELTQTQDYSYTYNVKIAPFSGGSLPPRIYKYKGSHLVAFCYRLSIRSIVDTNPVVMYKQFAESFDKGQTWWQFRTETPLEKTRHSYDPYWKPQYGDLFEVDAVGPNLNYTCAAHLDSLGNMVWGLGDGAGQLFSHIENPSWPAYSASLYYNEEDDSWLIEPVDNDDPVHWGNKGVGDKHDDERPYNSDFSFYGLSATKLYKNSTDTIMMWGEGYANRYPRVGVTSLDLHTFLKDYYATANETNQLNTTAILDENGNSFEEVEMGEIIQISNGDILGVFSAKKDGRWAVYLTRSTDLGQTFYHAEKIVYSDTYDYRSPFIIQLSNKGVVVCFGTNEDAVGSRVDAVKLVISTDRGYTFKNKARIYKADHNFSVYSLSPLCTPKIIQFANGEIYSFIEVPTDTSGYFRWMVRVKLNISV